MGMGVGIPPHHSGHGSRASGLQKKHNNQERKYTLHTLPWEWPPCRKEKWGYNWRPYDNKWQEDQWRCKGVCLFLVIFEGFSLHFQAGWILQAVGSTQSSWWLGQRWEDSVSLQGAINIYIEFMLNYTHTTLYGCGAGLEIIPAITTTLIIEYLLLKIQLYILTGYFNRLPTFWPSYTHNLECISFIKTPRCK